MGMDINAKNWMVVTFFRADRTNFIDFYQILLNPVFYLGI